MREADDGGQAGWGAAPAPRAKWRLARSGAVAVVDPRQLRNLARSANGVPPTPEKFPPATRASLGRVAVLVLVSALVWIAHHDRWTLDSWRVPTDYAGDSHEVLARLKAASEGETWPLLPQVIDRLGAPFGAHWNGYPTPDKPLMLALGALSHLTGLFAAANLGLLLAQISAAAAFYVTARWLRAHPEWALTGALLFSFTYQTFHRGLAHFSFVFTWSVPLGLLSVWLIARSRRLAWTAEIGRAHV